MGRDDFRVEFTPQFFQQLVGEGEKPPSKRSSAEPKKSLPPLIVGIPRLPLPHTLRPRQEEINAASDSEQSLAADERLSELKTEEDEARHEEKADESKQDPDEAKAAEKVSEKLAEEPQAKFSAHQHEDANPVEVEEKPVEVARDLQPLLRVLEKTEKHVEEVKKRGVEELEAVKKRAEELQQRHHVSAPVQRSQPCLAERDDCIRCYKAQDPFRCKLEADAYVRCTAEAFKATVS